MSDEIVIEHPLEYDAKVYEAYYSYTYGCLNCDMQTRKLIKKGTLKKDTSIECPNCGCKIQG